MSGVPRGLRHGRTGAACALTLAAVALPCGAWYLVGSREAAREAAGIASAPRLEARGTAERLARHLGERLETLRENESNRPPAHYAHRERLPLAGCDCPVFRASPLAAADPMIRTHFQIDQTGRLSLPALDAEPHGGGEDPWIAEHRNLLETLGCATTALVAAAEGTPRPRPPPPEDPASDPDRLLLVGPFRWRTVELGGAPALVAVRQVKTTGQELLQGFVVSPGGLRNAVSGSAFPVHLIPGEPAGDFEAALPVPGAAWRLRVDAGSASSRARGRAEDVVARFRRTFLAGSAAAAAAGLLVIGLIAQSERMGRERARFAASAAHELRTPLAGLRLHAEMLADSLGDPARSRSYARRVADEADRLGRVVSNVLGYTRLSQGTFATRPETGDLAAVVRACASRLAPLVESAGARLVLDIADPLPQVRFDPDAVHRILENLVDNAEKYARQAADRTIGIRVGPAPGGGVALSVSDRGPGIPRPLTRRSFRPFVRGTGGDGPAGLGLGLAMVQTLARDQGGEVTCAPAPGGGSVFTVTFPQGPSQAQA